MDRATRASKLNQSLLSNSTTPVKLQINESASAYGGLGLVATENISAAEDILSKKQILVVADNNHFETTCNSCFMWLGSEIGTNDCIRAAGDTEPALKKCIDYKVVKYCSIVSYIHCFTSNTFMLVI